MSRLVVVGHVSRTLTEGGAGVRRALTGCLIALLVMATPGLATAATWSKLNVPSPLIPNAQLAAASCSSGTACMAVGQNFNTTGAYLPTAETWNGTAWSLHSAPGPVNGEFQAVSCTSPSACTAVGNGLAERWNGTGWTVQTPAPAGDLLGVSCPSATTCFAVGYQSGNTTRAFAARWNGSSWSAQTLPLPAVSDNSLNGISCASATACTAVGWTAPIGFTSKSLLVEYWDGSNWTLGSAPVPAGATSAELRAVSCVAATTCTAVGDYNVPGVIYTLAESWNGGSWAVQSTPNPAQGNADVLTGVSCQSAGACSAVGYYLNISPGTQQPMAEQWSGGSWSLESVPLSRSYARGSGLAGVSCAPGGPCIAVGSGNVTPAVPQPIVESWGGSAWALQTVPTPLGSLGAELTGVSCASATACTVVGWYYGPTGGQQPLVDRWNGSGWSIQTVPRPSGAASTHLTAVSCPTATSCTAVGNYATTWNNYALAEQWNGTSWSVQTIPNPAGTYDSALVGVSCASATQCAAVGSYSPTYYQYYALAEQWNGTAWSLEPTPNPDDGPFAGVSCPSTSSCTAVGNQYDATTGNGLTLVELWNGSSWATETSPNEPGADANPLKGVSCATTSACEAVGSYSTPTYWADETLAEGWNGTSWSLQNPANPYNTSVELNSVSCPTSSFCEAVGDAGALAEGWNGSTWSIQPTLPGGGFKAVSCPSSSLCIAVGWTAGSGTQLPLAEQYS